MIYRYTNIAAAAILFLGMGVTSTTQAAEPHVALITERLPEIRTSIVTDVTISTIQMANAERSMPSQEDVDKMEM